MGAGRLAAGRGAPRFAPSPKLLKLLNPTRLFSPPGIAAAPASLRSGKAQRPRSDGGSSTNSESTLAMRMYRYSLKLNAYTRDECADAGDKGYRHCSRRWRVGSDTNAD